MKSTSSLAAWAFCALCVLVAHVPAQSMQWKPVDPAHLTLKAAAVEKDADAEALLWEVYINTASDAGTDFTHFVRIKIFTERGKEAHSKIDIPYLSDVSVKDVAARTIKPDGTIIELKKDAIFDRELVKAGSFKLKAKSFAIPGIEPGAIIEYRWREVYGYITNYVKMELQREIPTHVVRYYLKPNPYVSSPMRTIAFQASAQQFVKDRDGYFRMELTNVPAFREEAHMPPEDQVKAWMLVFYSPDARKAPVEFWKDEGKRVYELRKGEMKLTDEVRRVANEAIGDATQPEQKLERLFNYSRTKIKNVADDASGLTAEQLAKLKENRSPAETLKRGYGNGSDINFLFAAMAAASGFDARYALIGDRSRKFFDMNFLDSYFLRGYNIAVKLGDGWRFFDPGSAYVPFGMLRWQEEGMKALVTDSKEPQFVDTLLAPPEKSVTKRSAKLRLSEDGTLEGQVQVEFTGHFAVDMKEEYDDETPETREKRLSDSVKGRIGAEVSEIKIQSATDPVKPFVYSYKVRVPGYAERTGKRLFLQPGVLSERTGSDVSIQFATSRYLFPFSVHRSRTTSRSRYPKASSWTMPTHRARSILVMPAIMTSRSVLTKDQKTLVYSRTLRFTLLVIEKKNYPLLKKAFDVIHLSDQHAITLKQNASASATKQ